MFSSVVAKNFLRIATPLVQNILLRDKLSFNKHEMLPESAKLRHFAEK